MMRLALTIFTFAVLIPIGAAAQTTTDGAIRGRITDEKGGALPGVSVTAASPYVGGTHTVVSDGEGAYRLINLPPAESYTVVAELQGFAKFEQSGVNVRAGLNLALDISLRIGSLSETIQVVGAATPVLETIKSVQTVNISGDLVRALPLTSRRDWSDVLQLSPGTLSASTDRRGGQVYFLRGSENENHVVALDGADIGSFGQNWPSNFVGLSTDALGDIEVKTGAMDASAPNAMGMVINIATKSGSDQFRGSVSAGFTPRSWNGNNTPDGTSPVSELIQPDFSLGGPIRKGHAWFYVAERYIFRNDGISRDGRQLSLLQDLDPSFEPFDNTARATVSFVTAAANLTSRHKVSGFFQRDARKQGQNSQNWGGEFDLSEVGGEAYSSRISSVWTDSLTTRFLVSYNNKGVNRSAGVFEGLGNGPSRSVASGVRLSSGRLVSTGTLVVLDNVSSRQLEPSSKPTISGDVTYYRSGGWGTHELQGGFYLQPHLRYKSTTIYSNAGFATEDVVLRDANDPAAGFVPYHRVYYDQPSGVTGWIGAEDYAVYAQDSWRPTERLTLNLGIRADYVASRDLLFDVPTSGAWNVGPRTGATYALTSNSRNIVRGSWSRVYDIPNASYLGSAGTNRVGSRDEYDLDLNGTFETVFVTPQATALSTNREVDPTRHQGYIDETIVGYRTQLPGEFSLDVSYIDRSYRDRPAQVDVNSIFDDGVFRGYVDPDFNELYLVTNNRWNWFVYRGLELTANKRSKDFQFYTTYTRSTQHLGGTWQPNDPASIVQPEAFANDAGLGTVRGNVTNSFGADTRNRMWQKHAWRTGITWFAPWELIVATNFSLQSGTPSGPVTRFLPEGDPQFGPPTVTLPNGRVVSNPLATTTRFAFDDRGTGQVWTPWLNAWNARVGRRFPFGRTTIDASLDVFNITNNAADQQFLSAGNQIDSPNFGLLTNRQLPRSFQAVVRVQF